MPITLDDYVFSDWEHANAAIVGAVRDRVIADFSGVRWEQEGFEEMGRRLIDAILNDKEYIVLEDMASIQFDDDYGHVATVTERKKIIINSRKFSRVRFPRATFDGVFSVKHTVPPAFDLGRDQSVKALEVIFNEAPAVGSVVQAEVAFNCVGSFSSAKEFFGLNALQTIRRGVFSMTVPAKRRILKCVATLIHRGIERDVSDKLFVDDRHVSVEIAPMPVGSRLVVEWLW
ncbi:hypothetical protein W911_08290 [Hyphomicrobium nitrativorans NL23]|uniref:Uncharacterized protein n=2 Tax=Hyphomicrobium TaxID=81 RepID=V5SGV9_9HYPH|nr:hypothetical protein W911_08290 [Hyphomicrobium nitrativorans NL23]